SGARGVPVIRTPLPRGVVTAEGWRGVGHHSRVVIARRSLVACAPLVPPADRLHERWAGPLQPVRSSVWSRSQGASGGMGASQNTQRAWPVLTVAAHLWRSRWCRVPYPRDEVVGGMGGHLPGEGASLAPGGRGVDE